MGIWLSFLSFAWLASCRLSLSRVCVAYIVSVSCGVVVPSVAWGDKTRRVGGAIWGDGPPSRSIRLAPQFVRFSRIGLRTGGDVRRFCQLVSLRHSVGGGSVSFFFFFRLVPRIACPSRLGVSLSSPYSFVLSGGSWGVSCLLCPPCLVISCSCLISLVVSHVHDGGGLSLSSRCGVFPSRCPVVGFDWAMVVVVVVVVDGRAVRRYDGRAVLFSSIVPSG